MRRAKGENHVRTIRSLWQRALSHVQLCRSSDNGGRRKRLIGWPAGRVAVVVSDVDAMPSFDGDLAHFVGDRVISNPSQAVNARPDHEMRSSFSSRLLEPRRTTLAITDMDGKRSSSAHLNGA
ncbi:hypothetical protein [Bradyrhizobium zhanjiangense]|uniref:hypothetical protein n=1 Tax=Bradyrhizobium zhanjiangense TaxID=1325107 RepID=UPI0013E8A825|nr:hypothetical protein [Bradyrhizobium zhanjiangense]